MPHDSCDEKIYDRLRDLEIFRGKYEEKMEPVIEFIRDAKQELKALRKSSIISEVRMTVIIGVAIWVANHYFK